MLDVRVQPLAILHLAYFTWNKEVDTLNRSSPRRAHHDVHPSYRPQDWHTTMSREEFNYHKPSALTIQQRTGALDIRRTILQTPTLTLPGFCWRSTYDGSCGLGNLITVLQLSKKARDTHQTHAEQPWLVKIKWVYSSTHAAR